MAARESVIIGIDPGMARTGWGVIGCDGFQARYIASGYCSSPASAPVASRLLSLSEGLAKALEAYKPDYAAIEETFVNSNARTSLILGQARGALLLTLARAGLTVSEYTPATVKKNIAGNGRAGKEQIAAMLAYLLPGYTPDNAPADVTDALAIALCRSRALQFERATAQTG